MMKKLNVVSLLCGLQLLFSAAYAQTPQACQAQLRHFTVPDYPRVYAGPGIPNDHGLVKLPSRLLFSDNGIEVYANKFPDGRDFFLDQVAGTGMSVLIVYQDEGVRQAMIKELRDKRASLTLGNAPFENFKFAEIDFLPDEILTLPDGRSAANPFAEKWHISQIAYSEPEACWPVSQDEAGVRIKTPESIASEQGRIKVDSFPLWSKALEAMLAWVKKCAALTGG